MSTNRPLSRMILRMSGAGTDPDPAVYCPANGYYEDIFTEANGWLLLGELETTSGSSETFDPAFVGTGQFGWDFRDGSRLTNDRSVSHTYLDTSTKFVKIYTKGICTVTNVDFNTDQIRGVVDLSKAIFTTITGLWLNHNTGLAEVIFPISVPGNMVAIALNNTGIAGIVDLSVFTKFSTSAQIALHVTPNLTGVVFAPSITGTITAITIHTSSITGVLDLSMFNAFTNSAQIQLYNTPNLTGIIFSPTTISGTLSNLYIYSSGIAGVLDLSSLSRFTTGGNIYLYSNPNLTGVLFGSTIVGTISSIYIYSSGITGVLDLSMFKTFITGFGLQLQQNPNLTGIIFSPTTITGSAATIAITSTGITGVLDLSKIIAFSSTAQLLLSSNPNMTGVSFASTITGTLSVLQLNSCNLTGTLDLSMFKSFSTVCSIYIYSNPNLTQILLSPTVTTGRVLQIMIYLTGLTYLDLTKFASSINSASFSLQVQNNAINAANLNRMLVEINTIATSGFSGRTLVMGGSNGIPDSSSGGYDGLAAKAALIAKGFTVTTN